MRLAAKGLDPRSINEAIRSAKGMIELDSCCGQRFIGCGLDTGHLMIKGVPGNALGAYLDGATITVKGNVQDAVGDTMNDGLIVVHGSAGDGLGYTMRGGRIFVRDNVGSRAGVHIKECGDKKPLIVIGGHAGCFLGEYLAGGTIVVLGLNDDTVPAGSFVGVGMHGGAIYLRTTQAPQNIPDHVAIRSATAEDIKKITPAVTEFAEYFSYDTAHVLEQCFYVLEPKSGNPYQDHYVKN